MAPLDPANPDSPYWWNTDSPYWWCVEARIAHEMRVREGKALPAAVFCFPISAKREDVLTLTPMAWIRYVSRGQGALHIKVANDGPATGAVAFAWLPRNA